MAISRPLLIVLVVALVGLVVMTGIRVLGSGGDEASPAAKTTVAPTADAGGAAGAKEPAAADKPSQPAGQAPAKAAKKAAPPSDPQAPVLEAIAARKVVVLFFGQWRGADDMATRRAINQLGRDPRGVEVFTASIKDVADYPRVVGGLGVAQSPSTVIIDRQAQARVVQGFIDAGSLRQLVDDARS